MSLPSTFLISWWYSPDTKLGIYFNDFGLNAEVETLEAFADQGVDSTNGMGASVQEDYHFENLITNHPVENTVAISDHIINQPITITVTGLLTSLQTLQLGGFNTGEGIINFSQLGNAIQILSDMAQDNVGVSLTTGLLYGTQYARFDNLAVQTLDIPRTNEYGRSSIKFTIVFKQLIITSTNGTTTTAGFSQAVPITGVDIA